MRSLALALAALPSLALAEAPCGSDAACETDGGTYHMIAPPDWDGVTPLPALIFFHGHNSRASMVFRSAGLKADFVDKGYLLIAPNGQVVSGNGTRAWPARPGYDGRDDVAFTLDVLDDAAAQVPVDRDRVYVAGFSAGGSMAWMMGCYAAEHFGGVISVSGALRRPIPEARCPGGPFNLLQVHGFGDAQVPFEGRAIRDWHQGDLFEALGLLRQTNACRSNPDAITIGTPFRCREWSASCENGAITYCEHDGGHGLPRGWTAMARDWIEAQ